MAAVLASILLAVLDHRYRHLEAVRSFLAVVTYPVQYVASLPVDIGTRLVESFTSRRLLEEHNSRLHKENILLKARLQQFEALEAENMRLRDLVGSSFKVGDRVLIAELLSIDLDPYKQEVIINKGSLHGVFVGQPILDAHAVMGQVVHVTPFAATVILITDASHALPVQVLRNGLRAIAVGTGQIDEIELSYVPQKADIRVNDRLVTSGLAGPFPPGYPVATVTEVKYETGQAFATVIARPDAQLDRSREVLLVWTLSTNLPPIAQGSGVVTKPVAASQPAGGHSR